MDGNPINDIRIGPDGQLQMEFDFNLGLRCYKEFTREDRCKEAGGCWSNIFSKFQFWLDIDFLLPETAPPGYEEDDFDWKLWRGLFKACFLGNIVGPTTDSMCIAMFNLYLGKVFSENSATVGDQFLAMMLGEFNDMFDIPVTDGGDVTPGTPGKGAGVPDGMTAALDTIISELVESGLWSFIELCSCNKISIKEQQDFLKQVELDIKTSKRQEWEDVIQHYVEAYWNSKVTGDTDYITNIESYDEIITLAATARSLGRS